MFSASHWRLGFAAAGEPGCHPATVAAKPSASETGDGRHYPLTLIESQADRLPARLLDAWPPPSRLADALAGRASATAGSGEDAMKAPNRPRFTPPIVAGPRTVTRSLARTLVVGGAVAGGFVLGLCIHGGIPLSGIELRRDPA